MRQGMKGMWSVYGGILLKETDNKYTRNFYYLSPMYEADVKAMEADSKKTSHFQDLRDEALEYAKSIMDPRYLNWVKVEWVWV